MFAFFLLYFVTVASNPKVVSPFLPYPVTQVFPSILPAMPMTKSNKFAALLNTELSIFFKA